ncbi:class I SAM-dependent methyltransferase [Cellulosimicrobium sp. PMB13]|uniref:class I SAM-dependent methyltransferase n=1 Tax=Cellulosimicrobium sp. PMB13 TaxID=3120158 RepID=UPI003F4C2536
MPIDFDDPANARTYSDRDVDPSWDRAITGVLDPRGRTVVDIGCGGGVYARAWLRLGAAAVTGVDSSASILEAARAQAPAGLDLHLGDAAATGLSAARVDVVFARALVHHVADLPAVVREAHRLLREGGRYLIQDRTMADVDQPGNERHPRGWLFDVFPRLRQVEAARRPDDASLRDALGAAGFDAPSVRRLWEVRRRYDDREAYLAEIGTRTGRSILHELDDDELSYLVSELRGRLPAGPVLERDRWTLWCAVR